MLDIGRNLGVSCVLAALAVVGCDKPTAAPTSASPTGASAPSTATSAPSAIPPVASSAPASSAAGTIGAICQEIRFEECKRRRECKVPNAPADCGDPSKLVPDRFCCEGNCATVATATSAERAACVAAIRIMGCDRFMVIGNATPRECTTLTLCGPGGRPASFCTPAASASTKTK